jgi:TonB-linked SusC/RagA family outer membrane protein
VALPALLSAQDSRTVTGQVREAESNQPLPGVRVTAKGTMLGTVTASDGRFTLRVPPSVTTLTFAAIGRKTVDVPVQDVVEVSLERQAIMLEGVVTTALGIEREGRELAAAAQVLQNADVTQTPDPNFVNTLQGKVAGVQIINAGPTGGTSRIVIRGASSLIGNNQPLFVVDGIPIDNSAAGAGYSRNQGFGGIDYGNAAQDIDPNNVESVTILKGPNAAALYGSRAQNGAIVITTKSGRGGALGISVSSSVTAETPLRLPQYQNVYGQGFDGLFQWSDGYGGGVNDYADESWGPRMDGRLIDQFTGPQQPFLPHPDNVRSFFRTGTTWNTNLAISRATETSNVRLSVTSAQIEGMMPGNSIGRLNLAVKGGAAISDRLSTEASVNYTNQDAENRPGTGYDEDNPLQSFIWFGRQNDMEALRHYRCDGNEPTACTVGGQYNWNYNYHNNPFWEQLVNGNGDERDRLLGHVQATYQLNDWITATGRVGRDWYRDHRKNWIEFNSLDDAGDGGFTEQTIFRAETNADLLLSATRQLTPDITLDVTAGGNVRDNRFETQGVNVPKLSAPGIFTIDNAAGPTDPFDDFQRKQVRGLYGSLSLNYRGYLNLEFSGRNDWSSTLPEGNNSYFYPAVGGAFVFTDAFTIPGTFLSSGKVRASWTRVGNDTDPYQLTRAFAAQQPWGSVPMFTFPDALHNSNLKPEQTTAWEVGADLGFVDERVGFVLTHYDRTTKDQILPVQISSTSGYTSQFLNAGKVRNYGWELLLRATPVRQPGGLAWDMTVNWGKNTSQVRELYGDLQTLVLGSYWSLNIEARGPRKDAQGNVVEYYPYGTFFGNGYLTDAQGNWLLDDDGLPQIDPTRRVMGNYNPDWNGGIQNRFSYGPFSLSVLLDGQVGGDIFSTTKWFGEYSGVLKETLRGRENAFYFDSTDVHPHPDTTVFRGRVCDPGIVVPGILPDNSVNGDGVNDVTVCPDDYFHFGNFGNHATGLVDASYLKLRELRVTYQLPTSVASRLGFSAGEVALIGRNLALWSKYDNIDPETAFDASNVQGIEFGQFPTARSLGISFTFRR